MGAGGEEALLDGQGALGEAVERGIEALEAALGRGEEGEAAFEEAELVGTGGEGLGGACFVIGGGAGEAG